MDDRRRDQSAADITMVIPSLRFCGPFLYCLYVLILPCLQTPHITEHNPQFRKQAKGSFVLNVNDCERWQCDTFKVFCWLVKSQLIHLHDVFEVKLKEAKISASMFMKWCHDTMSPSNEPACDVNITSSFLVWILPTETCWKQIKGSLELKLWTKST